MKRRKYNEDLDFKVVDDDGETIAVLGAGRTSALSASTLAWQAEVWPLGGVPACVMDLFCGCLLKLKLHHLTTADNLRMASCCI